MPHYWTGKINIVEMTILPKAIYRLNALPIQLPMAFFTDLGKQFFFNLYGNTKDSEWPKQFWEGTELEEPDSLTLDYITNPQSSKQNSTATKIDIEIIESPEISLHNYGQLIYDRGGKNIQWRKDCHFNKLY